MLVLWNMTAAEVSINECRCRRGSSCGIYARGEQGRRIHLVNDIPLDAIDAAHGRVGELVEGVGREVEIAVGASLAAVRQLDVDRLTLVCVRKQRLAGPKDGEGRFYVQVTLAVLPHKGLLFGLPPV